jgi:hypothetical protein
MENVVHKFPDILDDNLNTPLYLLQKAELTEAQYNMIKTYLGVYGPGRQVIQEGAKYYLLSDEDSEAAIVRITNDLAEKGQEFPTESDGD